MSNAQDQADILLRDKELVERVQRYKDTEAFGQLYDLYYQPILRFFLYRTADEDLAKDLTSETFYQALKSVWRFKWQGKPFSAWLYRIGHNQLMLYLRKNKHYCRLTCEEAPDLIAKLDERQDIVMLADEDEKSRLAEYSEVREAIKQLPSRQQTIIILRYFAKKQIKEISDIMRVPEGTIKSHIHRATKRLERILQDKKISPVLVENTNSPTLTKTEKSTNTI